MSSHFGWSLTESLTVQPTSAQSTYPRTQRPIEYLPNRWWSGGGWKSVGGVSCCYMKAVQYPRSSTSLLTVFCFHFRWWTNCKDLLSFFSLFLCRLIGELQVTGNFFKIFAALVVNCNECRNNKSSDNGCLPLTWANRSAYDLGKW